MTDTPKLLPCPFCGATMEDWHGQSFSHPLVEKRDDACILAGLSFSYQHSRWGTHEHVRWNRRHDAAVSAARKEGVRVKALEWGSRWSARSSIGDLYEMHQLSTNVISVVKNGTALSGWETTVSAAKAAAQADYESRILSALETTP